MSDRPSPFSDEVSATDDYGDFHPPQPAAQPTASPAELDERTLPVPVALMRRVLEALEFYGSPDTYFAIAIFPDPPCGEFIEDFSVTKDEDWQLGFDPSGGKPRLGKRAREALAAWDERMASVLERDPVPSVLDEGR